MTVLTFGTSSFLTNSILFFSLTQLSIPLAIPPGLFPKYFHQVLLSSPINKVSIVSFCPCLLYMWQACVNLKIWLATRSWAAWVRKSFPTLRRDRRNRRWTWRNAACVFLVLRIWGVFLYILNILIHGFEYGFKMGNVEGCYLGGGVCDDWFFAPSEVAKPVPP